uniref:Uncharacterized protein n=1 Tax=Anguilla anguilla TaxID=7936 RepID=A0A0E9R3D6_ANGAN
MQYLRSQDGGLKRDAVQTIQTQSRTRNVISHYALLALFISYGNCEPWCHYTYKGWLSSSQQGLTWIP